MAPRPAPAAAAALMDELVEEILFRIPPDDPARLLRAALVCKRWRRIVADPDFRRRFREFHRTPPMLGFLCSGGPWGPCGPSTSFVSTTSFRPSPAQVSYRAVDARHGRVLLHDVSWNHERKHWDDSFMVWDPITRGARATLPWRPGSWYQESNFLSSTWNWNAAVLCAAAADACDHLECHSGPFLVVFVASGKCRGRSGMRALVYSSEAAAWSQWIYAPRLNEEMQLVPSALAGNSMYFLCRKSVLKFDLATREMALIDLPQQTFGRPILRATEDGGLGLATVCSNELYLWSRELGPDEDAVWAQSKVIKLTELLPAEAVILDGPLGPPRVTGSAHGLDVILVRTSVGLFTINLKSVRVSKVCEDSWLNGFTFPYMSFNTPCTRYINMDDDLGRRHGSDDRCSQGGSSLGVILGHGGVVERATRKEGLATRKKRGGVEEEPRGTTRAQEERREVAMGRVGKSRKHWERPPLPNDQEQAPQTSDEHKILHCAALSVKVKRDHGSGY